MTESEQVLFKTISENNHRQLEQFLDLMKHAVNVVGVVESRGYSLLAFAAFKHHTHCFVYIYKHALKYNLPQYHPEEQLEMLQSWANCPTDEQFTALHFSAYHGNMEIIRILIQDMRADYNLKNVYGANVMHISAQGD